MKPFTALRSLLALLVATAASTLALAQCVTTHGPASTPGTWTPDASGEILTYSGNGLQYTRCQLGLSGAGCATGTAQTFTWQQALQASVAARIGGHDDWRLPNVQEAVALMDVSCTPALSPAFPAVSAGFQWTSTSFAVAGSTDAAWYINSFAGTAQFGQKSVQRAVILVRGNSTPGGNFDSLPAAIVSLTPSVMSTAQTTPFDVLVSLGSPATTQLGVSIAIQTQPVGLPASLSGNPFCSIAAGDSTCTVSGVQLAGPPGFYTFTGATTGGPPGGVTVNPSAQLELLAGPTASLTAPASVNQFAPFDVTLAMTSAASAGTSFQLAQSSGPTGTLGGGTTCTVPTGASTCTFTGVTFSGYGNGVGLAATSTAGPAVAVSGTTLDVSGLPVNINMGTQISALVGATFGTVFILDTALPVPVTMTSQQAGGPAGTFVAQSCTIAAGATSCLAFGNTFSAVGTLVMQPLLSAATPILVQSTQNVTIDIVVQGATLTAPASVVQFAPFNVTVTLAAGAVADTTFALAQASGPAGTLGGGNTCTVTAGNLSCVVSGVTFSGYGPGLGLTATVSAGPATPVSGTLLDVTAMPLSVVLIAPPAVAVGVPFSVTFNLGAPAPAPITLQLQQTAGPVAGIVGSTTCTVAAGSSSCSLNGLIANVAGSFSLGAVVSGAGRIDVVLTPASVLATQAAIEVPALGLAPLLALLLLTLLAGAYAVTRARRPDGA